MNTLHNKHSSRKYLHRNFNGHVNTLVSLPPTFSNLTIGFGPAGADVVRW